MAAAFKISVFAAAAASHTVSAVFSSMHQCERSAFMEVAKHCSSDVERLCRPKGGASFLERNLAEPKGLLDTAPNSQVTSHEIQSLLDQFLGPSFPGPLVSPSFGSFVMEPDVVLVMSSSFDNTNTDSVSALLQHVLSDWEPAHFPMISEAMNGRGLEMMSHPHDDSIVQTGRRLQAVSDSSVFLPFLESDCLDGLFQYELVSGSNQLTSQCSRAMKDLKTVRDRLQQEPTGKVHAVSFVVACGMALLGLLVFTLLNQDDENLEDVSSYYLSLDDDSSEKHLKVHVYEGVRVV